MRRALAGQMGCQPLGLAAETGRVPRRSEARERQVHARGRGEPHIVLDEPREGRKAHAQAPAAATPPAAARPRAAWE